MFRRREVDRLVRDHGKELTLSKTTSKGTYNPTTGEIDGDTSSFITFRGYMYHQDLGITDSTQLVNNSLKCLIPYTSLGVVVPTDEDSIDGKQITIVKKIESNGLTVCYLCNLKA